MATLKELYTTLKSLRDMKLPVDDKLLKAADNLEEQIIKEEILPSLSQNIEPLLSEIQRDLVLVVEYHPGEPISVALSRKAKISDFVDAKQLTPVSNRPVSSNMPYPVDPHEPTKHVENPTKGLRVTFPDGTVIWHRKAIDTYVETLKHIGFERVSALGIEHVGYNIVGHKMRPVEPGRVYQHEADGWYIYANMGNNVKIQDLKDISKALKLHLKIEELKPDAVEPVINAKSTVKGDTPQEQAFAQYLSKSIASSTINSYLNGMIVLGEYIRKYVDSSVQSIYDITDVHLMELCNEMLGQSEEYVAENERRHHQLSAALNKYIKYLGE